MWLKRLNTSDDKQKKKPPASVGSPRKRQSYKDDEEKKNDEEKEKTKVAEEDFIKLTVPFYTHSVEHAGALFQALLFLGKKKTGNLSSRPAMKRRHSTNNILNAAALREAVDFNAQPTELEVKHLICAAQETSRNRYNSASAMPSSPEGRKAWKQAQAIGEARASEAESKFGLPSFIEAVCTGFLMHLSFFVTEVRQNTNTVNKMSVFISHLAHWVEKNTPWDGWRPKVERRKREEDEEGEPQRPGDRMWSDQFFKADDYVVTWKQERHEKREWANRKRALWALQRLSYMDILDPPPHCMMMFSTLQPDLCPACNHTRSPNGWGDPHCWMCCCTSRALMLQLYPCSPLLCSPSMLELRNANMQGSAAAEPLPSPFTTATAFHPSNPTSPE